MRSHALWWCAGLAACALIRPSVVLAQERRGDEIVERIAADGPRAAAIRAEVDVVRREQAARATLTNPSLVYEREGAGFAEFFRVEQSLSALGVRSALLRAGEAATAAAEARREARLWHLRSDAAEMAARLLAAQDRSTAAEADRRTVDELVGLMRVREREGEGSRFDRLRTEQELAEASLTAGAALVDLVDLRHQLAAELPEGVTFTHVAGALYVDRPVPDAEMLVARAVRSRGEIRALDRAVDRTAQESLAARRTKWPTPLVSAGFKRADALVGREGGGVFGLSINVPVFDPGTRESARWSAERVRLLAERTIVERAIGAEVTVAAEVLALRQQALARASAVDQSDDLLSTARVAYREGEIGILGLLDAVKSVARSRMRTIEMRLDARLAEVALERAVGGVVWP